MPDAAAQKVLVVDDVPANIEILVEALGDIAEILFATRGEDALHIAAAASPDLILLDIMMPGMDGYEVCRRLKDDPLTRNTPVIFITAKDEEKDEARGLEVGAIDYVRKPFSVPVLRARVRNHLELKRRGDLLEGLATRDGLTGVANRRRFDEILAQEWRRARRHRTPLALVMLDIDHFKNYNDTYGHLEGDDCLKQVAAALEETANRPSDLVARYGGEEFVCLLPHTDIEGALHLAERMRQGVLALDIAHSASPTAERVTVSLGVVAMVPDGDDSAEILVAAADQNLYLAKQEGRNRVKG